MITVEIYETIANFVFGDIYSFLLLRQIPQFVIEAGYASEGKQIACTQPRRLVATALSRRVAQEMDVKLGEEVGYSVLFEDCTGPKTILK